MEAVEGGVERAREAYARREWRVAFEGFLAARATEELTADDLFALSDAAWWVGDVDTSVGAGEEAYRRFLHGERPAAAAMAAMSVAMNLLLRGETSLGSGWMSRAVRLVEDQPDTVEHWYLRYLTEVEGSIDESPRLTSTEFGDLIEVIREIDEAGRRLGSADLSVAATIAEGRVRLKRGQCSQALSLLDEAMLCLLTEDLAPDWAGSAYCHLMAACHEVGDVARAVEWTRATERWLDTMPAAALFRGICRVHRSQVLQTSGSWDEALTEAERVCLDLAGIAPATAAEAHYQVGDLRRLRGDLARAATAYQEAHVRGRDPQPGMALLRLAEGHVNDAVSAVAAAAVAHRGNVLASFPIWDAQVRIGVAAGRLSLAEEACAQLEAAATSYGTSGLESAALAARGIVNVAAERIDAGLPILREACRRWREVGAEFQAAEVCLWLAEAYRRLGAADSAQMEMVAATATFDRLGVASSMRTPWLADVRAFPDGLTQREAEVLAHAAAGRSNRDIATALVISEKTVARHLSNIFTKIGVTSRTEAAAYAFEHGLHTRST